jgi:hypothetical protein
VLLAAALLAAGCGGDDDGNRKDVTGVGEVQVGSVAPLAQCQDWNAGSEDARLATIEDIRQHVNLQDGPVQTPALDDDEAYDLFERACERPSGTTVRLYTIYARAAGFASLLDN